MVGDMKFLIPASGQFFSLMFTRLDLRVLCSDLQLVSAVAFLTGKSKEWIKEHKESLFESEIVFF